MASWGLLGGLGQGLQQAGDNMYEQAKLQRIQEWKDQALQQQNAREDRIRAEDIARQDAASQANRDWERERLEIQNRNARGLAQMRASNSSSREPKIQMITTGRDEMGNEIKEPFVWGEVNGKPTLIPAPVYGVAAQGPQVTPEMEAKAREIAREKVDQQAGWLSSDSSDFAEYGGSRKAAEEQFYREALENLAGPRVAGGSNPLIQAVQSGQIKINDPGTSASRAAAAAQGDSAAPPQASLPQPQEFNPVASVGLLNNPAMTNSQPQDWQARNQQYEAIKPAIEMVRKKLDAGWAPEQEELERVRPYLTEKEIRLAEQRIMERKQYR
jgi:hypothetical protein